MVIHANIHLSNTINTEQVVFMYLGTHTYVTTLKEESHKSEREQGLGCTLEGWEGRKGEEMMQL